MSEVIITVRGEHEIRIAPEEGVVRVRVRTDGPERGPVVERVAELAAPLRDDLAARVDAGSVREWTSQRAAVWAERPWNDQGTQLPLVHHASVELTATFADFAALSWWVAEVAERDGVQIDGVQWRLTPATAKATEAEAAASAVRVAVDRATAYAGALGRSSISPLEIADLGLLTSSAGAPTRPEMMRMAKASFAADAAAPALEFRPEEIVVSAAVEGRFTAR